MAPRTYLFVPGNRPERFAKALASGADAVIFDLEDAVADDAKTAARDAIANWARAAAPAERARAVVRVNAAASAEHPHDLRMLHDAGLALVMLPKAESVAQLEAVCAALPGARLLALIESARGAGVERLVFGTLDLALDLDLVLDPNSATGSDGLSHAASRLVLASKLAGLDAPVSGVTPQIDDEARLLADFAWSRRHGMHARLCIHPRQIATIHAALAPGPSEIEWARRVLAAEAASPGAARLDGRMIDRPVVLQALRTLQRAES